MWVRFFLQHLYNLKTDNTGLENCAFIAHMRKVAPTRVTFVRHSALLLEDGNHLLRNKEKTMTFFSTPIARQYLDLIRCSKS